jgi:murein DD-endopeptidase MepM/ murein hydrolase activator NlpD
MTRIRSHLHVLVLFLSLSAAPLFAGETNGKKGDSVRVSVSTNVPYANAPTLSIIEKLNDEQLTRLIDMLFEMDSIPADIVAEIQRVVKLRHPEAPTPPTLPTDLEKVTVKNTMYDLSDSMPGTSYYKVWDQRHVVPVEDLLVKNDTSFTLQLTNDIIGNYTHPYSGSITSWFGWRDSTNHYGIDIKLNKGDPVVAAFEGKVRIARREGGFGNVVIIRHYNGLETVYGHLSKIKVKEGQVVRSGQVIGLGGSTGHSTGPHLHFEIRFKGVPINPIYIVSLQKEDLISSEIVLRKTRWGMSAYPVTATMYTIKKGDKLSLIAQQFNTTAKNLKELNAIPKGRYLYLRVGQQIRVE